MINQLIGGLIGYISRKFTTPHVQAMRELYEENQIRALSAMEDEDDYYSSSMSSFQSSSSSTESPGVSGRSVPTGYFESLEKRLNIEEEEFFKKEDFDVE